MRSFYALPLLASLTACAPAFADVTLQGLAGGDVVTASLPVTLSTQDFFYTTLDSGTTGSAAPSWLSVTPTEGYTNVQTQISADPSRLQAGSVSGRIVLTFPNGEPTVTQTVTFQVASAPPKLEVFPSSISMDGVNGDFIPVSAAVFVRNAGGGGPQPFTATLTGDAPFLTVTPSSSTTNQNSPALTIQDTGTPSAKTGTYTATLHIASGNQTQDVPITFLAKPDLLFFSLTKSGLLFNAEQGVGTSLTQTVRILDASAPVAWSATVASTQDFLTLSPNSGSATPGVGQLLTIGVKPLSTPGTYYALVTVTPTQFTDSIAPTYLSVVYNVTPTAPLPDLSPAGLIFIASGTSAPAAQNISIVASSTSPQPFELGLAGNFLEVPAATGSASGSALTPIAVSVDAGMLKPGFYRGAVQVNLPQLQTFRTADVLLVVPKGATSSAARGSALPHATTCTPSQIAVIGTSIAGNFSQPAAWPAIFEAQVVDDCANPVNDAQVVLSFSNGDPALAARLEACGQEQGCSGGNGSYSATWVPSATGPVSVTVRAQSGALSASAVYSGKVATNNVLTVPPNGAVNNLYSQAGAPLAPGTITAIYGSGLTSGAGGSPGKLPLVNTFDGTSVLIGGRPAPLYYTSTGQLNVQLPPELTPNQTYSMLVSVDGAISIPQNVIAGTTTPGVAAFSDGRLIAQHSDVNATLVDSTAPAKAGETLVMYLDGMGATMPAVASGAAAPGVEPLARVVNTPEVTVDGTPAAIVYAGLTPFAVGLFQIDFTVPPSAKTGNLDVVVMQNGVAANATTLPVISN
jgi:uncharacterized protein (TIGR03437 family)